MSVFGIILKVDNPKFHLNPSALNLYGKTMIQWVSSCFEEEPFIYDYFEKNELLSDLKEIIKSNADKKDYTVVVYSDTPLITKKTLDEAVLCLQENNFPVVKMTLGFVFDNSKLDSIDSLKRLSTHYFTSEEDFLTASSMRTLSLVSDILRQRILYTYMRKGVYFVDPSNTYVDYNVEIEGGTIIYPNNYITGATVIKKNARIENNNVIHESIIGENCKILSSTLKEADVGDNTTVGPNAYLRPNAKIGQNCKIGDFVEIKNAFIGDGTKISHLTYVGDCTIGTNCNLGCGVVLCNYDGKKKYHSTIGNNVFVGSNVNLVAPVNIEDNSVLAAGSTITDDVPKNSLAIARARQVTKPDYYIQNTEEEENGNT